MNIIDGFQKKQIKIIEKLITAIGWSFMVGYLIQIALSVALWTFNLSNFYHKLLIFPDIKTTLNTLLITVLISIVAFLTIFSWGRYNYKKYAHLRRRNFPEDVTTEEVVEYFNLSLETVVDMQNNKRIVLEKTIV